MLAMVFPSSFTVGSMSRHTFMWKAMVVWPKFDWDGKEFVQVEKTGIKANDFKKIKKMVDDNADIILKRWKEYFDKETKED